MSSLITSVLLFSFRLLIQAFSFLRYFFLCSFNFMALFEKYMYMYISFGGYQVSMFVSACGNCFWLCLRLNLVILFKNFYEFLVLELANGFCI